MSALEDLRHLFEEAGLMVPPVPAALEARLRERERWAFATREIDPMAMYMFDSYLIEALVGAVEDYVAVSHAGHGVNSYGLNYHLVYGPIAVFTQTGWGGVYMDSELSAADVSRQFTQCADLIDAAEGVIDRGPLPAARLIVAESTFRDRSICKWLDRPLVDARAAAQWLDQANEEQTEPQAERAAQSLGEPGVIARAIQMVQAVT